MKIKDILIILLLICGLIFFWVKFARARVTIDVYDEVVYFQNIMYSNYCFKHWPKKVGAIMIYKGYSLCEIHLEKQLQ